MISFLWAINTCYQLNFVHSRQSFRREVVNLIKLFVMCQLKSD